MPLSTHHRNDRRRRVIRESIAADADFAVESARASRRARRPATGIPEDFLANRDPGYSQAVRKTCQHRWVQLIPVRHASLAMVIAGLWVLWGVLLASHYWFHVRANDDGRSRLLFLQLLDIRSPHSIANWLTCQLWMLTALVAWMIYQLRRHKLDDFRAKYRVWIALTGVAIFSSFDASTSCLYLLGQSLDTWTRREIGYGGWPLVLATYASLVGLLGIRLSSELKSVPAALGLWLLGLLAWASAALLGTGLLKLEWNPGTIDLVVGGCWLGGVLAVFQAAGLVLRHCYLQAQKRFIERTALNPTGRTLVLPGWLRRGESVNENGPDAARRTTAAETQFAADSEVPWKETSPGMFASLARRMGLPWGHKMTIDDEKDTDLDPEHEEESPQTKQQEKDSRSSKKSTGKSSDREPAADPSKTLPDPRRPMRLFGWIPQRHECNEAQIPDEPLRIDEGGEVDEGLTKKPGWFGIGGNRSVAAGSTTKSSPTPEKPGTESRQSTSHNSTTKDGSRESTQKNRTWMPKWGRSRTDTDRDEGDSEETITTRSTSPKPAGKMADSSNGANPAASPTHKNDGTRPPSRSKEPTSETAVVSKKGWLGFGRKLKNQSAAGTDQEKDKDRMQAASKPAGTPKHATRESDASGTDGKPKKLAGRVMGWFDGLKLKPPPAEDAMKSTTSSSAPAPTKGNPPRSDTAENYPKPVSVNSNTSARPLPSTHANAPVSAPLPTDTSYSDGHEDESNEYRPLSKAERKRLRRQQNDRDAA